MEAGREGGEESGVLGPLAVERLDERVEVGGAGPGLVGSLVGEGEQRVGGGRVPHLDGREDRVRDGGHGRGRRVGARPVDDGHNGEGHHEPEDDEERHAHAAVGESELGHGEKGGGGGAGSPSRRGAVRTSGP